MAEVLTTLNTAKYSEYETRIATKRRRLIELSEDDMVRINHQIVQWLLGAVSGDAIIQSAALAELEEIYDETITPPTSLIAASVTSLNSRRGRSVAIVAGSNAITFSSALPAATYSLTIRTFTSNGGMIQYSVDPTSLTVNGFTLVSASNGFLDYIALYN
jgi:3-oxoacyl-ACP reductase-like protein